jgi:hypothetical protein
MQGLAVANADPVDYRGAGRTGRYVVVRLLSIIFRLLLRFCLADLFCEILF